MREIKFRGKRVDNGEWVYGFYFEIEHNDDKTHVHGYITANPLLEKMPESAEPFVEVVPETVGQFTGVLDKNGVEIYDGDPVLAVFMGGHGSGFSREWSKPILVKKGKRGGYEPLERCEWWEEDGRVMSIEVIGNIHENPNLLKEARA